MTKTAHKSLSLSAVLFFLLAGLFFLSQKEAKAIEVPQFIGFSGQLTNSSGTALTASYDIVFRIYDVVTGGTALWTETQTGVSVDEGYFSVTLGDTTALNLDFDTRYWVGVTVATDAEMTPRQPIDSVGYAFATDVTYGTYTSTTAPTAAAGRLYYDTDDDNLYVYDADAASWVDLTVQGGGGAFDGRLSDTDISQVTDGTTTSTLAANYLAIATSSSNNLGLFYVDGSGNVSASGTLDVQGLATFSGAVTSTIVTTSQYMTIGDINDNSDASFSNGSLNISGLTFTSGGILSTASSSFVGDVTLGNTSGDLLSVFARIDTDIVPEENDDASLGIAGNAWSRVYASTTLFVGDGGSQVSIDNNSIDSEGALTVQTTGSVDLELRTGSFDNAIVIDDSGSGVGIGRTTADAALHVTGGILASASSTFASNLHSQGLLTASSTLFVEGLATFSGNASTTILNVGDYITVGDVNGDASASTANGAINAGSNIFTKANLIVNGNSTLGSDSTDSVLVNGQIASNLTPNINNFFDLGGYNSTWNELYSSGTLYVGGAGGQMSISSGVITTENGLTLTSGGSDSIVLDPGTASVLPGTNNNDNLGAFGTAWNELYASGTLYVGVAGSQVSLDSNSLDSEGALTLQTTAAADIELRTASFDNAIYISDGDSRVGIGTTGPDTALHVVGGLLTTASSTIGGNLHANGNLTASSTLVVDGTGTINGNVIIGDQASDTLTINARIATGLEPVNNDSNDIGGFGNAWTNIFASGTAFIGATGNDTRIANGVVSTTGNIAGDSLFINDSADDSILRISMDNDLTNDTTLFLNVDGEYQLLLRNDVALNQSLRTSDAVFFDEVTLGTGNGLALVRAEDSFSTARELLFYVDDSDRSLRILGNATLDQAVASTSTPTFAGIIASANNDGTLGRFGNAFSEAYVSTTIYLGDTNAAVTLTDSALGAESNFVVQSAGGGLTLQTGAFNNAISINDANQTIGIGTNSPTASLFVSSTNDTIPGFAVSSTSQVFAVTAEGTVFLSDGYDGSNLASSAGLFVGGGVAVSNDDDNNVISDGSNGSGSATLYIGNETIDTTASDIRLKENVEDSSVDYFEVLDSFRVVDFDWKAGTKRAERGRTTGLIAQEVYEFLPQVVHKPNDPNNIWSIEYQHIVPYLIQAVNTHQDQIQSLSVGSEIQGNSNGNIDQDQLSVSNSVFAGNVIVKGHASFGEDSTGYARILPGDREVSIVFEEEYDLQPVVVVTPRGEHGYNARDYFVKDESTTGFTIALLSPLSEIVEFSWLAFGTDGGKITISDQTYEDIEIVIGEQQNAPEQNEAEESQTEPVEEENEENDETPVDEEVEEDDSSEDNSEGAEEETSSDEEVENSDDESDSSDENEENSEDQESNEENNESEETVLADQEEEEEETDIENQDEVTETTEEEVVDNTEDEAETETAAEDSEEDLEETTEEDSEDNEDVTT